MLIDLGWLPAPPADFRERLRAIEQDVADGQSPGLLEKVVALATAALDEAQLSRLARLAGRLAQTPAASAGFSHARVGIVGDGTLSLCGGPLAGSALRHGLVLEIVEGSYGSAVQEAVDRSSILHTAGLDFLLVIPDLRMLGLETAAVSPEQAEAAVEAAMGRLRLIVDNLRGSVKASILVQTVPPPIDGLFGSLDRVLPTSPFSMVEAFNRRLAEWAASGAILLVDVARTAATVGLENWDEPGHWFASKLPFAPSMLPLWADIVARTLAAARGRSRKCLVLDLDNTLWGGVIGDDGVEGIKLGQGSATGEAFIAIQRLALELRGRGVVLAVCSKNEEDAARLPFREHPEMVLREDHIAAFHANWTDKAANLRAIAEALNIGVDSLVFLDDNPAERLQVRAALPLVGVPELPDDPAFYPRALMAAGYFEAVAFSQEDRQRADMYQANAERAQAMAASGDLGAYLESLEMVCSIRRVDPVTRARAAQLINKSNQYNLTTHRYTESEVEAAEKDPRRHVVCIRLTDRFGDNGIISVIIADKGDEAWEIDTWLMSCRVLGRRVQEAVLAHLAAAARAEGAVRLVGRFIPSPKNRMVTGHYESLGFTLAEARPDGETTWTLELADYVSPSLPMKIDDVSGPRVEALA
jgi:FkbH-like protein